MTDERIEGQTWKRAAELVGVSFPNRTIELVVIPYEDPAMVGWGDRMVQETIARGAFDGIQRRPNRVPVNVDHQETVQHTIGRAIAFHPSREEGLVAEIKIARTDLGNDTLELAADGDLGASAGFKPMDDGVEWENQDAYRVTKAWLRHIAMTPIPAYEGARVLAVRSRDEPAGGEPRVTPNLDLVRGWVLSDRYESLGA